MSRVPDIDTARALISIGVHAALNATRDTTTDRNAIIDRQVLELCARAEHDRKEARRQAYERNKAKDPDALRARTWGDEAVREWAPLPPPLAMTISPWSPTVAKGNFLAAFERAYAHSRQAPPF